MSDKMQLPKLGEPKERDYTGQFKYTLDDVIETDFMGNPLTSAYRNELRKKRKVRANEFNRNIMCMGKMLDVSVYDAPTYRIHTSERKPKHH